MSNVKEATDFGVQLVQKLYGNPFYLSPFYKPTKEDIQAQEVYDVANTFMVGAKELSDAVTKLEAIRSTKPLPQMTAEEQKYYNQLFQRAWTLQTQLEQANRSAGGGTQAINHALNSVCGSGLEKAPDFSDFDLNSSQCLADL